MEKRFLWSIDRIDAKEERRVWLETKIWMPLLSMTVPARARDCRDHSSSESWVACSAGVVNRRFLWLLLAAYAAAAMWPRAGLWIRGVSFGEGSVGSSHITFTLPLFLLAVLLANAGLTVRTECLTRLRRSPWLLAAGLSANLLVPLTVLLVVTLILRRCTDAVEAQQLLIGLTLVVAMPVAASSAAWSQSSGGDVSLSLGLILGSTLLSPFTTPLVLHAASCLTGGDGAAVLLALAKETNAFLLAGIVLPSTLGLLGHRLLGDERIQRWRPYLGLVNALVLLTLCYANAAVSLPHAIAYPDWTYLIWATVLVAILCALLFSAGWGLARLFKSDEGQKFALMYGMGMNNNGAGLVLAGTMLTFPSETLLPLLLYNLVQHLAAGFIKSAARPAATPAPRRQSS
ncbi:MAG: bile acid:sodium symporter family protein [Gemmataceae bacterium]